MKYITDYVFIKRVCMCVSADRVLQFYKRIFVIANVVLPDY